MYYPDAITDDEIDLIRKFRELDEHGKRRVLRYLHGEYYDTRAGVGEKILSCDFSWVKNSVVTVGNDTTDLL